VIILAFCAAAGVGVQYLGYIEFGVAGRMFADGAFWKHLHHRITLRSIEDALAGAETLEDCWSVICDVCPQFGFARAEMNYKEEHFTQTWTDVHSNPVWNLEIPLAEGRLFLTRSCTEPHAPTVVAPLAESLHRALTRVMETHDRKSEVAAA